MKPLSDEAVHTHLVREILRSGFVAPREQVAAQLGVADGEVEDAYRSLAEAHGLVLHPHMAEPWVVHPFSLAPTHTWVDAGGRGWWAPCMWCAFGVASLAGGEVRIEARLGGEREAVSILVRNGVPVSPEGLVAHFAIPPKRAWDNVHLHCSLVVPFRSATEVRSWCERHGVAFGEAVPLAQAAALAREWYGSHASEGWHKWSKAEAQAIFRRSGLTSAFWDLGPAVGGF